MVCATCVAIAIETNLLLRVHGNVVSLDLIAIDNDELSACVQ
jgi:hypothetical protein